MTDTAMSIWRAGVDAVRPQDLVGRALSSLPANERRAIENAPRIIVVGAGKAGANMAEGIEIALRECLDRVEGIVNVPDESVRVLNKIRLHPARPSQINRPTEQGVDGSRKILELLSSASDNDVAICLFSGGGSALLPYPVSGITLEDKLSVTESLHRCGATIAEMNTIRKHLSAIKGGRLAEGFRGKLLLSLIISDVIGDPLDIIASGPTTPDPSTFADCLEVIERYGIDKELPQAVIDYLQNGVHAQHSETPKSLPTSIQNYLIGTNHDALLASQSVASSQGYTVCNLGSFLAGDTQDLACFVTSLVRSIRKHALPIAPPCCLLLGGETTVALKYSRGKGGRNQEFVLAMLRELGLESMNGVCILSGGTDGEDGPTDAAGAIATEQTLQCSLQLGLVIDDYLANHDSYTFFDTAGGLVKTGLTGTNVMDVRLVLIDSV